MHPRMAHVNYRVNIGIARGCEVSGANEDALENYTSRAATQKPPAMLGIGPRSPCVHQEFVRETRQMSIWMLAERVLRP